MSRRCCGCKQPIPETSSAWRDMTGKYACNACYKPAATTAVVVVNR